MSKEIFTRFAYISKLACVFITAAFITSCNNLPFKSEYKNVDSYTHPDVPDDEKVIFIVGNEGPNPVSFVRICTEDFKEKVGKWTDHRLPNSVQAGEVIVIEQPNWFPVRRLCAYSKNRYANYIGTHVISEIVHPGEHGAGIYYLGTVKTPDNVSAYKLNDLYMSEMTETVKLDLIEAVQTYPNHKTINFDLSHE